MCVYVCVCTHLCTATYFCLLIIENLSLPPPLPALFTPSRSVAVSTTAQQSTPTLSIMAGPGGSQLTVTLQQLQALLTAQITGATKPQLVPLALPQPPIQPVPTPPPPAPPVTIPSSALQPEPVVKPLFSCMWGNCGEKFESSMELMNHMLRLGPGSHISREVTGDYFCRWTNCPRHKDLNGKPFDTLQKITRHVKEVHLMRVVSRPLSVEQSRLDSRPRSSLAQDQPIIPTPIPTGSGSSSSNVLFPQTPTVKLLNPLQLTPQVTPISNLTNLPVSLATSTMVATMAVPPVQPLSVTATPLQSLVLEQSSPAQPPAATAVTSTVVSTSPATSSLPVEEQARMDPRVVAQSTSREKRSVVHSAIYMK